MLVVNVGVLVYTTTIGGGSRENPALQTMIENLEYQLNSAKLDIETLKEEIRIIGLPPNSPDIGVIEIY